MDQISSKKTFAMDVVALKSEIRKTSTFRLFDIDKFEMLYINIVETFNVRTLSSNLTGEITEKAVQRSLFFDYMARLLNANSTKTHYSRVTFYNFCRLEIFFCTGKQVVQ